MPEGSPMFNPTQIVITAFIRELREMYDRTYGTLEPGFPGVISFVAQLSEAGSLDCRDVDKHIPAAALRLNEPIPLLRVEPLPLSRFAPQARGLFDLAAAFFRTWTSR
jgi:hypothetical protein